MMFLDYQMRGGIFIGPFSAPTLSFANQFYSLGLAEPVRLLFAPFPICPLTAGHYVNSPLLLGSYTNIGNQCNGCY